MGFLNAVRELGRMEAEMLAKKRDVLLEDDPFENIANFLSLPMPLDSKEKGQIIRVWLKVRNVEEANRAIEARARVVGVNARDFTTMTLNREAFAEIAPGLPTETIRVALSGVRNARELLSYAATGADAVVIGEELVRAASPRAFTRALVAAGQHPSCPSRE